MQNTVEIKLDELSDDEAQKNEEFVKLFITNGDISTLLDWLRYLRATECFHLSVLVAELFYDIFGYNISFLDEFGMAYYYTRNFRESWRVYQEILSSTGLTEDRVRAYTFNSHFSIPHIEDEFIEYPEHIVRQIQFNKNPIPLVTFSITTCKRYDLFEKTMNSFIQCCEDVQLVTNWICVDDNSSDEDRQKMTHKYPFFKFIWKTPEQKGHAHSMNLILQNVHTPYLFHMEDDWKFFTRKPYIQNCIEVINEHPQHGQCLVNRNYAETFEDIRIIGGFFKQTAYGLRYWEHDHETDANAFVQKYGEGSNCAYWPHYSLRPGLNRVSMFRSIGMYNPDASHFEMEYSYRYTEKGYKTTFLDGISCLHIGRLTRDRNDTTKQNAYTLNGEHQFIRPSADTEKKEEEKIKEKKEISPRISKLDLQDKESSKRLKGNCKMFIINLDRRKDRLDSMIEKLSNSIKEGEVFYDTYRYSAVDGSKLTPCRRIDQIFEGNDYNYRRNMIGCSLSHIDLWVQLVNEPDEDITYIIIEDDVELVPYFSVKVQLLLKESSDPEKEWAVIFLGHHVHSQYKTDDLYHRYALPVASQWTTTRSFTESKGGTGGYMISKKGAQSLLMFLHDKSIFQGIDTMMQHACDSMPILYCVPHLIRSECYSLENLDADTDIQRNYDSLSRDNELRLEEEIRFFQSMNVECKQVDDLNSGVSSNERIVYISKEFSGYVRPTDIRDYQKNVLVYETEEDKASNNWKRAVYRMGPYFICMPKQVAIQVNTYRLMCGGKFTVADLIENA